MDFLANAKDTGPARWGGYMKLAWRTILCLSLGLVCAHMALLAQSPIKDLVFIKGGDFVMGSPPKEEGHQRIEAQRLVRVNDFYIGKYEFTLREFKYYFPGLDFDFFVWEDDDRLPVSNISKELAGVICNRINKREGYDYTYITCEVGSIPIEGSVGYRLPTQEEWEYACRAGTSTAFYFGPDINLKQANFNARSPYGKAKSQISVYRPLPVGSFPANSWGLHDMHGNVWEWCQGGISLTRQRSEESGPAAKEFDRLSNLCQDALYLRGGSWDYEARYARSAHIFSTGQLYNKGNAGLRILIPAPGGRLPPKTREPKFKDSTDDPYGVEDCRENG